MEVENIDILKARLQMQKARIEDLEKLNSDYLNRIDAQDKIILELTKKLKGVENA